MESRTIYREFVKLECPILLSHEFSDTSSLKGEQSRFPLFLETKIPSVTVDVNIKGRKPCKQIWYYINAT